MGTRNHKAILEKIKNKGKKTTPTNSEKVPDIKPYKKKIFDMYVTWYCIPLLTKNMSEAMRTDFGWNNDEITKELMSIRTKSAFAEKYNVDMNTLKDWEETAVFKDEFKNTKRWLSKATPRVLMSLTTQAIRSGKAPEVMAWMKIVNDFTEKVSFTPGGAVYIVEEKRKQEIKQSFKKNAHRR